MLTKTPASVKSAHPQTVMIITVVFVETDVNVKLRHKFLLALHMKVLLCCGFNCLNCQLFLKDRRRGRRKNIWVGEDLSNARQC